MNNKKMKSLKLVDDVLDKHGRFFFVNSLKDRTRFELWRWGGGVVVEWWWRGGG